MSHKQLHQKRIYACLYIYRLPWIAPELFSNLSKTTIATDVYAFSTTLWECASTGRSPLCINPLKDFGTDSNKVYFLWECVSYRRNYLIY